MKVKLKPIYRKLKSSNKVTIEDYFKANYFYYRIVGDTKYCEKRVFILKKTPAQRI